MVRSFLVRFVVASIVFLTLYVLVQPLILGLPVWPEAAAAEPMRQVWKAPPPPDCADPTGCIEASGGWGGICGMGGMEAMPFLLAYAVARRRWTPRGETAKS